MSHENDPYAEWNEACEKCKRAVAECIPFELRGDTCIEYAYSLLGLAHRLKGVACSVCNGVGSRSYPSTATWRGGIGGQAFTVDVCDTCWGTGRNDQTGPDLRAMNRHIRTLEHALRLCGAEPCTYRSDVDCLYRWGEAEQGKWCASCRARAALGVSKRGGQAK